MQISEDDPVQVKAAEITSLEAKINRTDPKRKVRSLPPATIAFYTFDKRVSCCHIFVLQD